MSGGSGIVKELCGHAAVGVGDLTLCWCSAEQCSVPWFAKGTHENNLNGKNGAEWQRLLL